MSSWPCDTTGQRESSALPCSPWRGGGIGLVDGVVALGREELGLRQLGPAREVALLAPVQLAHLLQADDVGIELLDRMAEVVDLQPPRAARCPAHPCGCCRWRPAAGMRAHSRKLWQHQDRFGVGRRKAGVGRLAPGQPPPGRVLARVQRHRRAVAARTGRTRARCCASRPAHSGAASAGRCRRRSPAASRAGRCSACPAAVDAGFLDHLARRGVRERLVLVVLAAGHRLPEVGRIGAVDQQHVERRRVDHDQHRLGDLEGRGMRCIVMPGTNRRAGRCRSSRLR